MTRNEPVTQIVRRGGGKHISVFWPSSVKMLGIYGRTAPRGGRRLDTRPDGDELAEWVYQVWLSGTWLIQRNGKSEEAHVVICRQKVDKGAKLGRD